MFVPVFFTGRCTARLLKLKQMSKSILILGASGRTGRELVRQSLLRGWQVKVLVRTPGKFPFKANHQLTLVEGSVADPGVLAAAMEGCGAVMSALNISRRSDFPWSPLRTPVDFLSETMKKLVALAPEYGIDRLIFTSAWGVGDSRGDIPRWFRWVIENSNIAPAYIDHEKQEAVAAASMLRWTVVRSVGLLNGKSGKPVQVSLSAGKKPSLTIRRSAVAAFMIQELEKNEYVRQKPVLWQ